MQTADAIAPQNFPGPRHRRCVRTIGFMPFRLLLERSERLHLAGS